MLVVGGLRGFVGRVLGRAAAFPLVVDHFSGDGGARRRGMASETATKWGLRVYYGRSNLGESLAIGDVDEIGRAHV